MNPLKTATAMNNLGVSLINKGQFPAANTVLRQTLQILKMCFEDDNNNNDMACSLALQSATQTAIEYSHEQPHAYYIQPFYCSDSSVHEMCKILESDNNNNMLLCPIFIDSFDEFSSTPDFISAVALYNLGLACCATRHYNQSHRLLSKARTVLSKLDNCNLFNLCLAGLAARIHASVLQALGMYKYACATRQFDQVLCREVQEIYSSILYADFVEHAAAA